MVKTLSELNDEIQDLHYDLLDAQLEKDWVEAARISLDIHRAEERERQILSNSKSLRAHERAVS